MDSIERYNFFFQFFEIAYEGWGTIDRKEAAGRGKDESVMRFACCCGFVGLRAVMGFYYVESIDRLFVFEGFRNRILAMCASVKVVRGASLSRCVRWMSTIR